MLLKKALSSLLLLFPLFLLAQKVNISGKVLEQDSISPAVGASVSLLSTVNNAYLRGQQTGSNGNFQIPEVDPGTYNLQVTFVGYKTFTRSNFVVEPGKDINLGSIVLVEEGELLSEIVVQGQVPDLQIGIDKKVFDVSQSMVSVGGSAQDLLGNVPTLQLESDGSVSLRGSTNVRFLVDGKESAMAGSDINSFLQSLPADAIAKVEIITNPSAKYDAEGQSGIINIILKKNARLGLNGSVTASGGSYENANAGVTLNYRAGKMNYFGNYNFARRHSLGDGTSDNVDYINGAITDLSPRTQSIEESSRLGYNHTIRFGTDYYMNDKTTLSLTTNLSLRDNERGNDINYNYWNVPGLGSSSFRNSLQHEDDLGIDAQVDFKRTLNREGEELTANVSFGYDTEDGVNDFHQTFANGNADLKRVNNTSESGKNWNMQLDYVLPFGENHKFEAGYRSILRYSDESQYSEELDSLTQNFIPDYRITNDFDMASTVHALYANYQRQITDKFGAQVGLRAEQANLNTNIYSHDLENPSIIKNDQGKLDYFRLYPSVFLSYAVGEGKSDKVQLSYSRRVQRPRGWQVNPFIDVSDVQNYRQGNPNLMPEDIHATELSFSKFYTKWNFVASAFYRRVNDQTQPVIYDEDLIADIVGDRTNVTYMKWENASDLDAAGFELISKVNLTKWWDVTGNANLSHITFHPKDGLGLVGRNSFNWNANLTTNVKITPTFSAQVRGDYRSGMKTMQGEMEPMKGVDLALKKDVLKNRGTFMLNVRDAFNTRKFQMHNYLPNRETQFSHRWMRRMITLSFSYRFGIQNLGKNNREERQPEMEDMGGQQF
ncbi:TonB-dependent receptor domain-containing protein [Sphingobacterium lactis]|uniref:TonB-dependent receptor domain-containing protein n=1 Tax=Sphingobacterium lactis TaxID=797291 RepID=UPI003DA52F03